VSFTKAQIITAKNISHYTQHRHNLRFFPLSFWARRRIPAAAQSLRGDSSLRSEWHRTLGM